MEILNFDENDAIVYGKVRNDLKKAGSLIGSLDMLIASQALARDLTLVSQY